MKPRAPLSIRSRLIILAVVSIALAQGVGLGISIWQEMSRYAQSKRDVLFAAAETFAAAAARGTSERDSDAIYQAIRAISRIPGLTFAEVLTQEGVSLADLGATEQLASELVIDDAAAPLPIWRLLASRSIELTVPVVYQGAGVGRLRIIGETSDLPQRIVSAVQWSGIGALIAMAVALAVALRMQGAITKPLLSLSAAMGRVRSNHDYALAIPKASNDEIGVLIDGFNGMLANIRERDDRLERHREQLEQDVADRTRDYRDAAAEAASASRAKSDFLATMSHEIRTPMNGILVMAELLAKTELPRHARRQAEVIARSGESLLAIINDILDFSKIEAGKLDVETLDLDAAEAIEGVMRLFADRAESKGLDFAADIDLPPGALIAADPVRVGQVLGNLVNNALKFTDKGGVTVAARFATDAPDRVRFSVTDTGIGIPEDKLGAIFEQFSQADQSTTRQFGGTGLGLSIARRLVSAMDGELEVSSRLGKGSCFAFTLPLAATRSDAAWPAMPAAAIAPRAVVALTSPATEAMVSRYLEAAGFSVERVAPRQVADASVGAVLVVASAELIERSARLALAGGGGIVAIAKPAQDIRGLMSAGRADLVIPWPVMRRDLAEAVAALAAGRPLASLQDEAGKQNGDGPRFAGMRVLVADDSEVNREVAHAALQRLGVTPDFAVDGRQAVEAVRVGAYDLVLMDGSMPELDGFDATRAIRARETAENLPRLPVVALTAHVVGEAADAWRAAGMDGVLHKPFTLAQLANCLATHAPATISASAEEMEPVAIQSDETAPALDRRALDELRAMAAGSDEVVRRIVRLYQSQSTERAAELRNAVASQDLDRLARAAHALKSMSLNIGARRVAETAGSLEHGARMQGLLASPDLLDALDADLAAANIELERDAA